MAGRASIAGNARAVQVDFGGMNAFLARCLYLTAFVLGRLPWPLLRGLADGVAALWRRLGARESVVALRNLQLAHPDMPADERARLQRAILRTTARQALETLRLWTRPHADNLRLIRET